MPQLCYCQKQQRASPAIVVLPADRVDLESSVKAATDLQGEKSGRKVIEDGGTPQTWSLLASSHCASVKAALVKSLAKQLRNKTRKDSL